MNKQPEDNVGSPWIVSPAFDLCFVINVWWIVLSLPFFVLWDGDSPIRFWQAYFLTTPHRWMTLFLVAADPDRRAGRGPLFLLLAVFFAGVVAATHAIHGAFVCLALIDYVWNSWHFASQHGGILRIYSRKGGGGRPKLEVRIMRAFITYVPLRLAGWTTGWLEAYPNFEIGLRTFDILILILPLLLIALELYDGPNKRIGKLLYLLSVTAMYGALLLAVRNEWRGWMIALIPANAAFHAVEYMAIVTFYAKNRKSTGSVGLFQAAAQRWVIVIGVFIVAAGVVAGHTDRMTALIPFGSTQISVANAWYGANLWAAFLHYTYDGLIWKLRRPETARSLGVELPSTK